MTKEILSNLKKLNFFTFHIKTEKNYRSEDFIQLIHRPIKKLYSGMFLCVLFFLGCGQVAAADLGEIQNLFDSKQYSKAWQQLQQSKYENEGNAQFDFLYGAVAFEMGNYIQAIFALDRVTVVAPNHVNARIYLTRTYRKLNNNQAVRQQLGELHKLQKLASFSAEMKQKIAQLGGSSKEVLKPIFNATGILSVGHSDNINFGSDEDFIDSPTLGIVELRPSALRRSSSFREAKLILDLDMQTEQPPQSHQI